MENQKMEESNGWQLIDVSMVNSMVSWIYYGLIWVFYGFTMA